MGPAHRLLEAAAAPTLERIRRDRQKAPTQLQPLLAYLETHLFDPDLDANQLKRACGVRDNSLPIYFHHALSLPPYAYIEDCRLEVACRLLRDTDLKVWQIAQLLGYSTLQVFSRAFDRWSGLRPSVFRKRAKQEAQTTDSNSETSSSMLQEEDALISLSTLRKAINGGLGPEEADELARRLIRLYPESFARLADQGGEAENVPLGRDLVCLSANEAWKLLQERSREDQLELVRKDTRVASAELFDLLVAKGREISHIDIDRGIEIATLALDCLEELSGQLSEATYRQKEVQACSWLANSYRLAFGADPNNDLYDVEKALTRGNEALRSSCDPLIRAEFMLVKSSVRTWQRRFDEALVLANDLVALFPQLRQPEFQVRVLAHRARIHYTDGRISAGIPDLWRALESIDDVSDQRLKVSVYQTLCCGLVLEGQHREARRFLPHAKSLCQKVGLERGLAYVTWIEGLLEKDAKRPHLAEKCFRQARESFNSQGMTWPSATVALDLAHLLSVQGRVAETGELARQVIQVFERSSIKSEVVTAIQLLQQVARTESVCHSTHQVVRSALLKGQFPY